MKKNEKRIVHYIASMLFLYLGGEIIYLGELPQRNGGTYDAGSFTYFVAAFWIWFAIWIFIKADEDK